MKFEIAPKETEVRLNWADARLYCFSLDIDGKTGWRLPTIAEILKMHRSDNDLEVWYYWSSEDESDVSLSYGSKHNDVARLYKYYDECYVRAVRDLKDN